MIKSTKIDEVKFQEQRQFLIDCLTKGETGEGKFIVLNNEAGFSKSRITDEAIINNYSRKFLLVKKYNDEKYQSLKNMEEMDTSIIGEWPEDEVLVINADNSYKYEHVEGFRSKLIKAKVIIISHEKYRLLHDSHLKYLYTTDRHTLIIDEYLDVPIVSISEQKLHEYSVLFPKGMGKDEFNILETHLSGLLVEQRNDHNKGNMRLVNFDKFISKKLLEIVNELRNYFDENHKKLLADLANLTIGEQPITNLTYHQFFNEIQSILKNQCIYWSYKKTLMTYRHFDWWTLKNNIILDASGDILTEYKLNPDRFNIINQDKVFDYSNTTIHIKNVKSYKSYIEGNFGKKESESKENFYEPICEFIEDNLEEKDKVLIVNFKSHNSYFEELQGMYPEQIATAWHGNVLGKNTWRDFNKLFINSTYNIPDPAYLMTYSFFKEKKLKDKHLMMVNDSGRDFKTKEIEALRQNFILHNLYQTIKRINRDMDKQAEIFIITDNKHFIKGIARLLQDVNVDNAYDVNLPEEINVFEERDKYLLVEAELKRMRSADSKDRKQFEKALFCEKTGIDAKRLKHQLNYVKYLKELCVKYNVALNATFSRGCKYFVFK